jgi:rRNA processing protein Krr1/Pno1
VGIIGNIENMKTALYALENLIAGSKHASVYAYLEKKLAESKTASF